MGTKICWSEVVLSQNISSVPWLEILSQYYKIAEIRRAFWLVKNLSFIVPINPQNTELYFKKAIDRTFFRFTTPRLLVYKLFFYFPNSLRGFYHQLTEILLY